MPYVILDLATGEYLTTGDVYCCVNEDYSDMVLLHSSIEDAQICLNNHIQYSVNSSTLSYYFNRNPRSLCASRFEIQWVDDVICNS